MPGERFPGFFFNLKATMAQRSILCFGEVLWDVLPTGKIAGGAPMNVAFHANALGLDARMVSRVGADDLGNEISLFLKEKGVSIDLIQTDPTFPTGIVHVFLDEKGSPSYEIVQPVAWDFIRPSDDLHDAAAGVDALVFGSLACRSDRTKKTLLGLLELAALRVFDVNIRQPFCSKFLLEELLPKADIVKMNDEELVILANHWGAGELDEAAQMAFLKRKFDLETLIVTKGPHGASCLDETGMHHQTGFSVKVADTIGSGDAFLAGFISKMLAGENAGECLQFACAVGALVATKRGGTPELALAEIEAFAMQAG